MASYLVADKLKLEAGKVHGFGIETGRSITSVSIHTDNLCKSYNKHIPNACSRVELSRNQVITLHIRCSLCKITGYKIRQLLVQFSLSWVPKSTMVVVMCSKSL